MSTAKEEIRKLLEKLPDDAPFEDIRYHTFVHQKIERGLKDVEEGRVLDQEEVERRMAKWLGGGRGGLPVFKLEYLDRMGWASSIGHDSPRP
ncbi:MAG: hypothetical protein HYY53_02145 [candidate division NC10 bacterium]|nr:hypothetical protein [candidate division NC10 bacterium]